MQCMIAYMNIYISMAVTIFIAMQNQTATYPGRILQDFNVVLSLSSGI